MKLLVVGGGGREHAIIKKLKENPEVKMIYALPGNGGIGEDAVCVPEIGSKNIDGIVEFASAHKIDFAVVAPDRWRWAVWTACTRRGFPVLARRRRRPGLRAARYSPRT